MRRARKHDNFSTGGREKCRVARGKVRKAARLAQSAQTHALLAALFRRSDFRVRGPSMPVATTHILRLKAQQYCVLPQKARADQLSPGQRTFVRLAARLAEIPAHKRGKEEVRKARGCPAWPPQGNEVPGFRLEQDYLKMPPS